MSVIKFNRNFSDLFNWDTSEQPTTEQEYQNAVKNWTQTEMNLVDTVLWQPETAYSVGNIAKTPSLPSQYILVCTEAGDSGVAEPDYTGVSVGDTVVDGTVTWLVSTIANGGNIDALTTAVEANTQAIGEHSTAIAENTANVATNTADIATNTANIATNASDIANNTTDIEVADKRISNIEKLLQGNLYDYQTDTDSAYTKTVPAGAMPYAGIERIGGKTLVWNQPVGSYRTDGQTVTTDGVTATAILNGYGLSLTGTANSSVSYASFSVVSYKRYTGHKYFLRGCPLDPNRGFFITVSAAPTAAGDFGEGYFFTENSQVYGAAGYAIVRIKNGVTVENLEIIPQLFDITLMFGTGNEPTSAEEFNAMFPAEYYSPNAGTLLSAGVTEVESKKADTTTIATYQIPAEVQALDGYGWSAGTVYNYVDFERKVFVKCVDRVADAGEINWWEATRTASSGAEIHYFGTNHFQSKIKLPELSSKAGNLICSRYATYGYSVVYDGTTGTGVAIGGLVDVYDSTKENMTVEEFKNSMKGITFYYELAEPVETDISAYLTDDNLIEVEAGGTLTFPNSNGDNYRIPVPSEETYMINLQEAVSNG